MARILDLDELPHEAHSHEFVGADYDDVPFSIILVHSQPGLGPKLHRHPYAEVFLVESGEATFHIGDEYRVVPAGHVVVSPAGEAHGGGRHRVLDVVRAAQFYERLGFRRKMAKSEGVAFFEAGPVVLSL